MNNNTNSTTQTSDTRFSVLVWDSGIDLTELVEQSHEAAIDGLVYRFYPEHRWNDGAAIIVLFTDRELSDEDAQALFRDWAVDQRLLPENEQP